jgi:release factor glutamine methyltransferase
VSEHGFANMSVEAARRELARQLRSAQLDSPDLDARLLVGAATQLDLTGMTVAAQRALRDDESNRLESLAQRRLQHEPIARILGE